jgi:hypothetical protein
MKFRIILFILLASQFAIAQTKSKNLKLKYNLPAGWNAEEFGGKSPWEDSGNAMCHCGGALFFRSHKDGKMNVVVYPSTQSGLDSAKRNMVGPLRFEDVAKIDNVRNNGFSFQRKKSNFTDTRTGKKSFEVFRYFTKVDDHFYIIFAWQENMQPLNSTNEREVLQMVNAIEAN